MIVELIYIGVVLYFLTGRTARQYIPLDGPQIQHQTAETASGLPNT